MKQSRDIELTQSYDYQHQLRFVDANNAAIDVSAFTYTAYLALNGSTVATFNTDATDASSGCIVVSLTDEDISELTPGARYNWVVEQELSDITTPIVKGNVTVLSAVRD